MGAKLIWPRDMLALVDDGWLGLVGHGGAAVARGLKLTAQAIAIPTKYLFRQAVRGSIVFFVWFWLIN